MKEKIKKERRIEKMKGKRGITLIALIITIIVMLILVAVTINVAISGGLFGTAKKAVRKTEIAKLMEDWWVMKYAHYNEQTGAIENVTENWTGSGSLEEIWPGKYTKLNDMFAIQDNELVYIGTDPVVAQYFEELGATPIQICDTLTVAENGDITGSLNRTTYCKIGDTVNYVPDEVDSVISPEAQNGYGEQTVVQETEIDGDPVTWKVLGKDNINQGNILITTTAALNNVQEDSEEYLYFEGAKGYNNGPTELNRICSKLYSNQSKHAKARSMTIEDVDTLLGIDTNTLQRVYIKKNASSGVYDQTTANKDTVKKLNELVGLQSPMVDMGEGIDPITLWDRIAGDNASTANTFITPYTYGKDTDDEKNIMSAYYDTDNRRNTELAKYDLSYVYQCQYNSEETESPIVNFGDADISLGNISNIKAQLIFGPNGNDNEHWLASRGVFVGANVGIAAFCLGEIRYSCAQSGSFLCALFACCGEEDDICRRFASRSFPSGI